MLYRQQLSHYQLNTLLSLRAGAQSNATTAVHRVDWNSEISANDINNGDVRMTGTLVSVKCCLLLGCRVDKPVAAAHRKIRRGL